MRQKTLFTSFLVVMATASSGALGADETKDIYNGGAKQRLDAIASIQPGLGTVMTEYGNRFTDVYFAAKGGNWGLAQYQLKEMIEIQEVGEITRPGRADALKSFEDAYLKPLGETIENKDFAAFESSFKETIAGCNGCHAGTDHAFVKYILPQKPVEAYLDFTLKTDPAYEEPTE